MPKVVIREEDRKRMVSELATPPTDAAISIHYESVGDGLGDPLVFLSGLGGDHRAFSMALRHFGQSHQTLALDHRDSGLSSRVDADYTLTDLAADVCHVLDALGIPQAHIVGQSMGGLVAQELALLAPNRVRSLILVSTHAGMTPWRRGLVQSWMDIRNQFDAPTFTRLTLPWLVAPRFYQDSSHVEGMVRFVMRTPAGQQQDAAAYCRQARAILNHGESGSTLSRLGTILAPTLVLVGEDDLVNPPAIARQLASALPNAQLEILPHVGHLPHVEDGVTFRVAITAFLRRVVR